MERTVEKARANPHWSFSALNTYLNICSLKFYFQYIEHAPPERTGSCFAFGRAFHAALSAQAYMAKVGQSLSEKEGNDLFADFFSAEVKAAENLVYKPKETYDSLLETGFRMLRETVLAWQDYYTIRDVAQCFSIEVPGLNMPLIGELDCVVTDGTDTCIVDWKTSASKWAYGKADKDLQATIYTYAYKQMNGILPLFRFDVVTKTKTPSVENHYTRRNEEDFARFEFLANKVQEAVQKGVFLPAETSFSCADCAYANRCKKFHKEVR